MTLDEAQDRFRAKPTKENAKTYAATVEEYFEDGIIEEGTRNACITEALKVLKAH